MKPPKPKSPTPSTWEPVEKWYNNLVGQDGHYYHQHVIMPNLKRLLVFDKTKKNSVLDLACGQGVLARQLPSDIDYLGVDISPGLLKAAKQADKNPIHSYMVADITAPLDLKSPSFTHATIILAVQNLEHPLKAFQNAHKHLLPGGQLLMVLNHPCFRIPRQSSWQVDDSKKLQYRRLDRYFSPLKIPIQSQPSKGEQSTTTWSFHYPLSSYTKWLKESGFMVEEMEEWCSTKESTGSAAKMENRSRDEFPLFLTIVARKTR